MLKVAAVYRFIECNRSLEKLMGQDLKYDIKTSYKLVRTKREIDEVVDYVMGRFSMLCDGDVDVENMTDNQRVIMNSLLYQPVEIDIPEIDVDDIVGNDEVKASPSDVENILFLFEKSEGE